MYTYFSSHCLRPSLPGGKGERLEEPKEPYWLVEFSFSGSFVKKSWTHIAKDTFGLFIFSLFSLMEGQAHVGKKDLKTCSTVCTLFFSLKKSLIRDRMKDWSAKDITHNFISFVLDRLEHTINPISYPNGTLNETLANNISNVKH